MRQPPGPNEAINSRDTAALPQFQTREAILSVTATLRKDATKSILPGAQFLLKNHGPGVLVLDWRQPHPMMLAPDDFMIFPGTASADLVMMAAGADVTFSIEV